jgi:C-terminal processing protease CtpA/Prc
VDWIHDTALLGPELSQSLETVYRNRRPARQFYISLINGIANPQFANEFTYSTIKFPDSGFQLLALFRFWNMVEYFYPNRDVMSDDPAHSGDYWDDVLEEFIPRIALAPDIVAYQQELMKFIVNINDTHANLWTSIGVRPPIGPCQLPVDVRFVEGQPVVLRDISKTAGPVAGLLPGDVIEQLDGIPVSDLVNQWRSIYADSNDAARMRDIGRYLTRGACGAAAVVVRRGETRMTLQAARVTLASLDFTASYTHDRPGDAFQLLSNDIAYLKLSAVKAAESANYIQAAASTKGLIIDIRNYPAEFVVFTLGRLLVSEPTPFARFTAGDTSNPGAFHWYSPLMLLPQEPHYSGKVVILVDDVTQSQAEYTTMAFRTAPGAIVIGSTTAGADGDVSLILLPGGFSAYISGLGVFYPDKRATQRVGILPDIEVTPTIEGIRTGRDELLEEAIRQIKGQINPTLTFALSEQAATSVVTTGTLSKLSTGYAAIQPTNGSTPSGLAIVGIRQKNVLVSETTVPASTLVRNGRTYAEISSTVNTGLAIANPGNQTATISFYFSDSSGSFGNGTTTIGAKAQRAAFLNEAPFKGKTMANGTFTFSSSAPVAVTALRGLTNTRGEFLITTLPVIDLNSQTGSGALMFPHFADGGGWTTEIVLLNPTENVLAGSIHLRDPAGRPAMVNINNQQATTFSYSIPARGSQKLTTAGTGTAAVVGSVRVLPNANAASPFGVAVFSFRSGGTIASEAGVPAVSEGNAFRLYAQASGDFKAAAIGSIQTGLAVANASGDAALVTVELFKLDGTSTGLKGTLSVPANGQLATFLTQIAGLTSLQAPFQGTARVSSSTTVSVIGFRGRYNERRDFLITTIIPVDEASATVAAPLYFPQIADSGGYTTQFVLFSTRRGQPSSGTLSLLDQLGLPLNVIVR